MPTKLTQKQYDDLFAKPVKEKGSKRQPAFFEDEILKLKVGEHLQISQKEWETETKKEWRLLPMHYRSKFNKKYENNFLAYRKVSASEKNNNEESYVLTRIDPTKIVSKTKGQSDGSSKGQTDGKSKDNSPSKSK